jgi:hypothetical protein
MKFGAGTKLKTLDRRGRERIDLLVSVGITNCEWRLRVARTTTIY